MPQFANLYWSPDYQTSIRKLASQLQLSLGQLHELRKLVFSHIKYHHANGEFLAEVGHKSFPVDSSFRRGASSRQSSGVRRVSAQVPDIVDMRYVFQQFVERTSSELYLQQELASEIDTAVLEKITGFLKNYEPQIRASLVRFEELYLEYEISYETIESLKQKYASQLSMAEFKTQETGEGTVDDSMEKETDDTEQATDPISTELEQVSLDDQDLVLRDDYGFEFPLRIGGVLQFNSLEDLSSFLLTLTSAIQVTRRKIPIPGHTNELFSSDQLCEHFTRFRPPGFNPSRVNLERLGQDLMNLKLIVGTSFFAKKFTSEGMWFEWSEKVSQLVRGKGAGSESASINLPQSLKRLDETQKFMNDMAATTSKTFNGMFKSMKTSLMRPKASEESIKQIEDEYNQAYEELQRVRHLLDVEIYDKAQLFERFEKLKIEVIYQSLTKLLEVVYKHSLKSTNALHEFTLKFIEQYNKPQHYQRDYAKTLELFSTGIYFPSSIAPDYVSREHVSISQLNTNFQNLKLSFNLYKDVPLQLKVGDTIHATLDLGKRSLPLFLEEIFTFLNNQDEDIQSIWLEPIRHQDYWLLKDEVIGSIRGFEPDHSVIVHDPNAIEEAIILQVTSMLKTKSVQRVVNFAKNWLLEISDSVIPSTVYDSLLGIYTKKQDESDGSTSEEVVRVLKTTPRSNLSSLIFILEHLSKVQNLDTVDDVTESKDAIASDKVRKVTKSLNLMEAVGAVPFLHLILRPSVVKHATGFKPPLEAYDVILADLLRLDVRSKLMAGLIDSEKKFSEKQEIQLKNLGIAKKPAPLLLKTTKPATENPEVEVTPETPRTPPRIVSSIPLKTPNAGADSFSLRPFRTGLTPRPSPSSSPVHQKRRSGDQGTLPKSTSTNFLAPIDIKFEE